MSGFKDISATVKDLGGDDDDVALLKDIDIDGSDIEGDNVKADSSLVSDVDKMWKELNGTSKKIVFDDDKSKKTEEDAKADKVEADRKKREEKRLKKNEKKAEKAAKLKAEQPKTEQPKADKPSKPSKPEPAEKNQKNANKAQNKNQNREKSVVTSEPPAPKAQKQTNDRKLIPSDKQAQMIAKLQHPNQAILADVEWYNYNGNAGSKAVAPDQVEALKTKARQLLDHEAKLFQSEANKSRDHSASLEFLRNGTFSDQLGTLSLLSTESPLHNIKFLETLLEKCQVKHRDSATRALEVTKDLLTSHVLPDRRLKWFKDQNLTLDADIGTYIIWIYEDWLKDYFFKILQVMERLLSDVVENIRIRTLHVVFDFFQRKPEQELNLLRLGMNKLGDSSGKVASRVKKLLMDTLQVHPNMKSIVATAISEVLGRTADYRTRYYAVDALSEFILSQKDTKLPNQLVFIYLNLFERLLAEWGTKVDVREEKTVATKNGRKPLRGKKGGIRQEKKTESQAEEEQNARLVSKIFTGLNRAFPFAQVEPALFEKYTDTLYKMSHSPNTGTYIEALSFIFQLAKVQGGAGVDRYYRALYESLQDLRLYQSSKASKYLNLLLKSVANDLEQGRSLAFAKRIIQTALHWPEVGAAASLVHVTNFVPGVMFLMEDKKADIEEVYDIRNREPKYVKADTTKLWELLPLLNHYHPSVTLYAQNLLDVEKQKLDMPDIEQYSVNSFLSKWSYKKPKEKDNTRGGSMFQPLSGYTDLTLGLRQQGPASSIPITLQDWSNRKATDVAPDEQFFFEYFNKLAPKSKKASKKKSGDDDEEQSGDEDEIFDAIMRANPDELGGSDDNLGFSDMSADEDDEDDVDEEALAAAFGSDSEDDDGEQEDGIEMDSDEDGEALDDDEDGEGFENFDSDEVDLEGDDDEQDDDEEEEDPEEAKRTKAKDDKKKRKRDWATYPTFMDADAFEDMYSKKSKV